MAGFLRGKQAGIQNDLSAAILPGLFAPDDQARFGINSQIGYVGSSGPPPSPSLIMFYNQFLSIRPRTVSARDRDE